MDDTRLIYRLEDTALEGPFEAMGCSYLTHLARDVGLYKGNDWRQFHDPVRGFPGPMNDAGLARRWNAGKLDYWRFGCRSLDQLRRWFPKPLCDAIGPRQTLAVYRAPRKAVAFGRTQVAFDPDRAELVERLPLSALYV